jgi:hypothetical protein
MKTHFLDRAERGKEITAASHDQCRDIEGNALGWIDD